MLCASQHAQEDKAPTLNILLHLAFSPPLLATYGPPPCEAAGTPPPPHSQVLAMQARASAPLPLRQPFFSKGIRALATVWNPIKI
jgi:hypothetical protein